MVLGAQTGSLSKLARAVRKQLPHALVFAAQKKGFKASYADAVLPLPVSPNDLKVRLAELNAKKQAPPPTQRPGDGIGTDAANASRPRLARGLRPGDRA